MTNITHNGLKYYRLFLSIMVLMFLCIPSMYAQKVVWDTGYPQINDTKIGTYGDSRDLEIKFSVGESDLVKPSVKITLPEGIKFQSVSDGAGNTSGAIFSGSVNGQELLLTTSAGSIAIGSTVDVVVSFTAEGCKEGTVVFTTEVLSDKNLATDGKKTASIDVRRPELRIVPDNDVIVSPVTGTPVDFTLKIDVTNDLKATSMKVILNTDEYTDLSNFRLDGAALPAGNVSSTAGVTTIVLDNAVLGSPIETTARVLVFTAVSNVGGPRTLVLSGEYPATGPACYTIKENRLAVNYPTVPGTPNFSLPKDGLRQRWVSANDLNGTALNLHTEIIMDGVNASYLRLEYKNEGSAGAIQVKNAIDARRSALYEYGYIDVDNIKYSLDNGATIKTIPSSDIQINARATLDNGYRLLKPGMVDKVIKATVTVNDFVDVGKSIIFYWPIVQGDIYDNDTYRPTVSAGTAPYSSLQFMMYTLTATGGNGEAAGVPSNTYGEGALNMPKFMTELATRGMKEGGKGESEITLDLGTNHVPSDQFVDFVVKLPSWLELDGTPADAIDLPGGAVAAGYPVAEANNTYRVRYTNNTINNITVKYKVKAGQCTGVDQESEIAYWMDYNLGGNTPDRPVLRKIAKIYQPVILLCEKDGFEIKDFRLNRITRGLKDSDENYVPDDGQLALDSEIRHDIYLRNDEGQIILEGTALGNYNNFYMLLSTSFKLSDKTLKLGQAKIKVGNGAEQNADIVAVGDSSIYIAYNKPVSNNQDVVVNIPFTAMESNNLTKSLTVQAYVINSKPTDPFNPGADRAGTDRMGESLIIYNEAFARDRSNDVFPDNAVRQNFLFGYFDSYHGNNFYSPYFKNEIRRLAKPQTFTVEFPEGYLVKSNLKVESRYLRDQHAVDNPKQEAVLVSQSENIDGRITYTYDLTTLFADVKTQTEADALPADKWMHPDDVFYFAFGLDVQATKGAAPLGDVISNITYLNAVEADSLMERVHKFSISYTGDRTALTVTPPNVNAFEETVHVPIVTVLNPNAYDAKMWIYVDGDVKDVVAIPSLGGAPIQGKGIDNRWVDLGDIETRKSETFQINFTPLTTICSPDTVKIYTVSSFNTNWAPDFSQGIDPTDIDHVAAGKMITIAPTLATIEGSMTVSSTQLVYGTPYTLRAEVDSKASASVLMDPQMTISIPAGQKYIAGSAKVEYPKGTAPKAVPSVVEDALVASNANLGASRDFVFKVADAINSNKLLGFYSNVTDEEREVALIIDFEPECETPLTGIHFGGALMGHNMCGIVATGVDKQDLTQEMFSGLATDYEFNVVASIPSGNNAFNEIRREDKLKIDIFKKNGVNPIINTDALYLYLPEYLDVKDVANIEIKSSDLPAAQGKATVVENTVTKGTRLIKLALPVDAINADADHGINKTLSYELGLVYTPDKSRPSLIQNPVYSIKTIVTTDKKFTPSCPDAPMAIGNAEFKVALVSASENPYNGKVNEALSMQIINPSFAGEWFDAEAGGTTLSSTKLYEFTPTATGDVIFYVSSIFDGVNYGRVPILVNTSSVDFVVKNPDNPICEGSSIDLSTLVSGYDPSVTIKYYADIDATNELASSTVSPTVATVYYVRAESGSSVSAVKSIEVTVTPKTTITTQPVGVNVDDDATLMLSVVATGENLTYQWQKDGVDIGGATNSTYTKANATDVDKGVYTVIVSGDCGSVTSDVANVTVQPALEIVVTDPAAICEGESVDLATAVSGTTGLTLKYYSDAAGTKELATSIVSPAVTSLYYVQASNANGVKGEVKAIEVKVTEKTAIITQPVSVNADGHGNVTLSVVATGANLTYQWQKDGVDIAGATSATYTKADATDADKGVYTVIVSGGCGSVTSNGANVTVYPPLDLVVTDPAQICVGEFVDLTQLVLDAPSGLSVKYYTDANATAELSENPRTVAPKQTTDYYVQASNANGTKGAIKVIHVEVYIAPNASFSTTTETEVCENTEATVTLQLTGTAPWRIVYTDGTKDYTVSDINAATYTFSIPFAKTTTYSLKEVYDAHCQNLGLSSEITIEGATPVTIVKQPVGLTFCPSDAFTLSVEAEGRVESYQWFKNGVALNGETSETLTVNNPTDADNGEYHVEVVGKCGTVTSSNAKVIRTLDKVIIQKWNSTLVANNNDETNGGYKFVAYKWYKNGVFVGDKPYYTVGNDPYNLLDPNSVYHAEVTTTKGEVFTTCPFTPVLKEGSVSVYPNPVAVGDVVYVDANIDENALKGATVGVYSMSGLFVGNYKIKERVTELKLPLASGNYIVKFTSNEIEKSFVIIVK